VSKGDEVPESKEREAGKKSRSKPGDKKGRLITDNNQCSIESMMDAVHGKTEV